MTAEIEAFTKITDTDDSRVIVESSTKTSPPVIEIKDDSKSGIHESTTFPSTETSNIDRAEIIVSTTITSDVEPNKTPIKEIIIRTDENLKPIPAKRIKETTNLAEPVEHTEITTNVLTVESSTTKSSLEKNDVTTDNFNGIEVSKVDIKEIGQYSDKHADDEINYNLDNRENSNDHEDKMRKVIELSRASEERNFEVVEANKDINNEVIKENIVHNEQKETQVLVPKEIEISIVETKEKERSPIRTQDVVIPKIVVVEENVIERHHVKQVSKTPVHQIRQDPIGSEIDTSYEYNQDNTERKSLMEESIREVKPITPPRYSRSKTAPITPISSEVENILDAQTPGITPTKPTRFKFEDLRISESNSTPKSHPTSPTASTPTKSQPTTPTTIKTDNYEFHVRYVPLRGSEPKKESRHEQWTIENMRRSSSTEDLHNTGRRRSVKDIIESINKSQSLLKPAQTPETVDKQPQFSTEPKILPPPRRIHKIPSNEVLAITESTDSLTRNLNSLMEDEKKINQFIRQMSYRDEETSRSGENLQSPGKISELNNNANDDIFERCVLRSSTIDWNPIPKPRRSRNLSEELKNEKPSQ